MIKKEIPSVEKIYLLMELEAAVRSMSVVIKDNTVAGTIDGSEYSPGMFNRRSPDKRKVEVDVEGLNAVEAVFTKLDALK